MLSQAERFWRHVRKGDGCWEWTGTTSSGYGKMSRGHKGEGNVWAHRVSWEIHNGAIPEGLQVLHRCDNPPCVRPDHLFLGTRFDNMGDSARKLRSHRGEAHGMHKLRLKEVWQARSLREQGWPMAKIAALFSVSPTTIRDLLVGRTWFGL